jgi:hypothetical protein
MLGFDAFVLGKRVSVGQITTWCEDFDGSLRVVDEWFVLEKWARWTPTEVRVEGHGKKETEIGVTLTFERGILQHRARV